MKNTILTIILAIVLTIAPTEKPRAQLAVAEIIKAGIKKVIKAIDLKIQRLQNKTIWLQNAQKSIENTLSKVKLKEISGWLEKSREIYDSYYKELKVVKDLIAYYQRIRDITDQQVKMITEYREAWRIISADSHFSAEEIRYMEKVYTGILDDCLKNMDELIIVMNSFQTQMSDAKRLELINTAADKMETNFSDLRLFNRQNGILSMQRSESVNEREIIRKLYGL